MYDKPEGAKFGRKEISSIVTAMNRDYARYILKDAVRNALFYRRDDKQEQTGQHISRPYDQNEMLLKSATGILAKMTQDYVSRISANPAILQVHRMSDWGKEVSEKRDRDAEKVEAFLNGQSYACGNRRNQRLVAFDQARAGVGYYLTYEHGRGFGLPDRMYFDLTEGEATAERADEYLRRRTTTAKEKAEDDQPLWIEEVIPAGSVRLRRDRAGIKYAAIIEEIPSDSCEAYGDLAKSAADTWGDKSFEEYGLIKGQDGKIVAGIGVGTEPEQSNGADTWTLIRFFTREEIYYFVSASGNYDNGICVFYTKHDYREVPLFPAPFTEGTSSRPEEMYYGPLEAAYAEVPGLNQLETLLSNVAVYNATPRYVIQKKDGTPVMDEATGDPTILTFEPGVGLSPEEVAVIHGGELVPLQIENADILFNLLQAKKADLQSTLPSEAMTGAGATSGPAWTTRLMQTAANIPVAHAVENNASAVLAMNKMRVRVEKQRGGSFYSMTEPVTAGEKKLRRSLVEVSADELTTNLYVKQDPVTHEERITLQQVGMELFNAGFIDLHEFYETYYGSDSPDEMIKRYYRRQAVDGAMVQVMGRITQRVLGGLDPTLAEEVPKVAGEIADEIVTAGQDAAMAGSVAEAAGIRQAGMGASLTQPALPEAPDPSALSSGMVVAQ